MNEIIETSPARIRTQDAEHEAQSANERHIRDEFMRAAKLGDMNAKADFAPKVSSFKNGHVEYHVGTVGEAILSACDWNNGPGTSEVLAVLCATGFGRAEEFTAWQLINRIADKFVEISA